MTMYAPKIAKAFQPKLCTAAAPDSALASPASAVPVNHLPVVVIVGEPLAPALSMVVLSAVGDGDPLDAETDADVDFSEEEAVADFDAEADFDADFDEDLVSPLPSPFTLIL